MAKRKVIWTRSANIERKEILEYWIVRTSSKRYSIKLNKLFKEIPQLVAKFPEAGRKTNVENTRVKIVRDYLIFYNFNPKESVWDENRNDKESKYNFS